MSFNLIAISDVHLDAPSLLSIDEKNQLEKQKKEAFKKAIEVAIERNVSAFLICGDLFNEDAVSFETLIFLRKCFLDLASCDIKICYAHGKIDKNISPDIIKTQNLIDFSHEVELFDITQAAAIPVAKVCGAGYGSNTAFLIEQFEEKNSNYPTIGMLYEKNAFSKQGAFILDEIAGKNYDIFILGGYHCYVLARAENNILYLGSPTGTWFNDRAGGALYAEINDYGQVVLDKLSLSDVNWHDIEITNIVETDINALVRRIEIEVQSSINSALHAYVRVKISGRCIFAKHMTDDIIKMMSNKLSKTLDATVYIEKSSLMTMPQNSLLEGASPLVESIKIIELLKNDNEKINKFIDAAVSEHELFYSNLDDDKKTDYIKKIIRGLSETVCMVMIKEANYEN